jgi:GT2 family glycosyltransferase
LESIYKNTKDLSFEVVVVDNNSKDGSPEMVSKNFKDVILVENKENLGFSKANNIGIKKTTGRYVLFLNSDTLVYKDTLKVMIEFMDENKNVGASTCKLVLPNGGIDDASHRGFPTPWNSFAHFSGLSKLFPKTKLFVGYNQTYLDFDKTHEIDALAGAFMLVRRSAGEQVNWWDEDYFFYGEDLDFCYMLKKSGWKIYYVPKVSIFHYKGVSGGLKKISKDLTTADDSTKTKASKERFKAMRIFYKKHYEKSYPLLVTKLVYLGIWLKQKLSS